jgi:hypothetical protein
MVAGCKARISRRIYKHRDVGFVTSVIIEYFTLKSI